MTPDRKGLYLTVAVNEGDQYTVGDCNVMGNTLKYGEEMRKLITLEKGEVYSAREVTNIEKVLTNYLGKYGYAYSRVTAVPQYDEDNKVVNLNFMVEPGQRVYVTNVEIVGNTQTDDTVIRRELRQMDGTWLSTEDIERSKNRLNRLGFFETADVTTERNGISADTATVKATVKEQPTGSIQGGVGYGTSSGFMISASISQNNVFGWGSKAHISAYQNDYREHVEVGYTEPYYKIDQISLGGRIYYDNFHGDDANVVSYENETIGMDITTGYPLSENVYISYTAGVQHMDIKSNKAFLQAIDFWRTYGEGGMNNDFLNFTFEINLNRNNLNRSVFPTSGSRQNISLFSTIPSISDLQYYKIDAQTYHYFPLSSDHDFVFSLRARGAYGDGYGNSDGMAQKLPFFDNFYLGGDQWLRGFKRNSVGPRALYVNGEHSVSVDDDDNVGGNALLAVSAELIVPTPFISDSYKNQIRTAFFVDAGTLWDTTAGDYLANYPNAPEYDDPSRYSMSAGLAVTWLSPVGPLSFNLARALKKQDGDDTEVFSFEIGGRF